MMIQVSQLPDGLSLGQPPREGGLPTLGSFRLGHCLEVCRVASFPFGRAHPCGLKLSQRQVLKHRGSGG